MQKQTAHACLVSILAGCLTLCAAGNQSIGLVIARGGFLIDNSEVWGNATLLDGTTVATDRVPSELRLHTGERLRLGTSSRGIVHTNRMTLERGTGELLKAPQYYIEAHDLRVDSASPRASARVTCGEDRQVLVAAVDGPVRVRTRSGVLVASVAAGSTLSFDTPPQEAGAAALVEVRGVLRRVDGHFLLTDETTNVTMELTGEGLAQEVGQHIDVTGVLDPTAKPASSATQVVRISSVKRVPTAGVWANSSKTTKVAVIAGVAVASGVGIAAAVGLSGEEASTPVSR